MLKIMMIMKLLLVPSLKGPFGGWIRREKGSTKALHFNKDGWRKVFWTQKKKKIEFDHA